MRKSYRNSQYEIFQADVFDWLPKQRANLFHAVVTDPPFGLVEYSGRELIKRRNGSGGIWRLPNAFDGARRQPTPRFTVLDHHDHMGVLAFHMRLAPALYRILVPGSHVIISSQCLVSHLVSEAFCMAGFEPRGQIVRIVKTLRGGDRPKFGHRRFREVSVIPRSCFEPWLIFRKPCKGRVVENLERFGTGALRRPSVEQPLPDVISAPPARTHEKKLAQHPTLKPQFLMRWLVRASLPLGKGVVLDPFMGSGATLAAACSLGIRSVGVEIDYKYFVMARAAIPKLSQLHGGGKGESVENLAAPH